MKEIVTKEMLTPFMTPIDHACEMINNFISPNKKIQAHKGARIDGIHITSEGCWSELRLPQWVKTENANRDDKKYRFVCTETGEFLHW